MVEPSDSQDFVSPNASASNVKMLEHGLTALKAGQYQTAVTLLTPLLSTAQGNRRVNAQMGLIRAHSRLNQLSTAISLCTPLTHSDSSQVRAWAHKQLKVLQARQANNSVQASPPSPRVGDRSGFTPFTEDQVSATMAPPSTRGSVQPQQSATGALGNPNQASMEPSSDTFTSESVPPFALSPKALSKTPSGTRFKPSSETTDTTNAAQPPQSFGTSLFHYRQLNQTAEKLTNLPLKASAPSTRNIAGELFPSSLLSLRQQLQLWGLELLTALAFFLGVRGLLHFFCRRSNWLLAQLSWIDWPINVRPWHRFDDDYSWGVLLLLISLLLASPWLLDGLLQQLHGQQRLSSRQLKEHSPEALRLISRICRQHGWDFPELRHVPEATPLCFSYGWLPRNTRIVISQGLLDRVNAEQLTSLLAYEMAHLMQWDLPVISGIGVVLMLVYEGYWQISKWADKQRLPLLRVLAAAAAMLCYSLFWLLRKLGLWLSRYRSRLCDCAVVRLTQAPHIHRQNLLILMQGLAQAVTDQRATPPLAEALDILTPLSHQLAIGPGSCVNADAQTALFAWDYQNPYRRWMLWNLSHPLNGDRLKILEFYSASMELTSSSLLSNSTHIRLSTHMDVLSYLSPLVLQGGALVGALLGLAAAMGLWFLGGVVQPMNWIRMSWLYQDVGVVYGFVYLGLGIGLMVRINRLFPDLQTNATLKNPSLMALLKNPLNLPIDSQPIQLEGVLLGRPGIANWLCQDLILQTSTGLIKLHVLSGLGPIGNFGAHLHHPVHRLGQTVILRGWFRRGATAWIDVMTITQRGKQTAFSNPPIWATVTSLAACLWGIAILLRGY